MHGIPRVGFEPIARGKIFYCGVLCMEPHRGHALFCIVVFFCFDELLLNANLLLFGGLLLNRARLLILLLLLILDFLLFRSLLLNTSLLLILMPSSAAATNSWPSSISWSSPKRKPSTIFKMLLLNADLLLFSPASSISMYLVCPFRGIFCLLSCLYFKAN